ncbi:cupin-like domain-containing protein [Flavivirga jejuensis]|uniref:Cupin-like domain-containing protein n=1 Tax=Flavivirga jejuensis TaxID=870487 RepID=A0ABT8WVN2_9FLAO|nr:cupin-like domain-containing protein [Flavivirga jejuensis]MDO5977227.1 cupin-like domain-containing protein [Flavivirga jejuensis]
MNQLKFIDQLKSSEQVTVVDNITRNEFYENFVNKGKPVVIKGMTSNWKALEWNIEYFKSRERGVKIPIKKAKVEDGTQDRMILSDYLELLMRYEEDLKKGLTPDKLGYLHDLPFFFIFPEYQKDIEPFDVSLLPKWYRAKWQDYIQFFIGATGSLTPLHFDTLLTNNLFFQIVGKKKFILIDGNQKELCYLKGWRWARFDPNNPDYKIFPKAIEVRKKEVIIGPGDILYMPPGMLHQVHGLSESISFNIDWHTPKSARQGVAAIVKGAPLKNIYYNTLVYLGLSLNIPAKHIFPFYKSYLNYIS